jgi:hypothetical protein
MVYTERLTYVRGTYKQDQDHHDLCNVKTYLDGNVQAFHRDYLSI